MCVVIWSEICSLQYCSECWSENHDSNGVLTTTNCQTKYQSKSKGEIQSLTQHRRSQKREAEGWMFAQGERNKKSLQGKKTCLGQDRGNNTLVLS